MAFRSQMFVVGDLVEPNFNSTQQYGIGIVVDVRDCEFPPKVVVLWSNKELPFSEHYTDIIRLKVLD